MRKNSEKIYWDTAILEKNEPKNLEKIHTINRRVGCKYLSENIINFFVTHYPTSHAREWSLANENASIFFRLQ